MTAICAAIADCCSGVSTRPLACPEKVSLASPVKARFQRCSYGRQGAAARAGCHPRSPAAVARGEIVRVLLANPEDRVMAETGARAYRCGPSAWVMALPGDGFFGQAVDFALCFRFLIVNTRSGLGDSQATLGRTLVIV